MTNLLLIGSGDSIFLYNYVKALKQQRHDIRVTVYSPQPNNHLYNDLPYDEVCFNSFMNSKWNRIPFWSFFFLPIIQRIHFQRFIHNRFFEHIHIHRVLPAWVLFPKRFKKHCDKLYLTFWGGEIDHESLFSSHQLYLHKLESLVCVADKVIGVGNDKRIIERYPLIKWKFVYGSFGSSIIDALVENDLSSEEAKTFFSIPRDKISVLLGYSGKAIHNHIKVLDSIVSSPFYKKYKDRIHFLASMTRGSSPEYTKQVERALNNTSSSFTIIHDTYQTDQEVAMFRKATDVLMQLSSFDYLSASVKESLCAGTVLICGSWLPYKVLENDGFYYELVDDISGGAEMLFRVIEDFASYKSLANNNTVLGNKRYSWDACIMDWINAYES